MRILVDGIEIYRRWQTVIRSGICAWFALGVAAGFLCAQEVNRPRNAEAILETLRNMGPESIVGMGQPNPRIAPKSTPQPAELDEFRRRLDLQCRAWLEWLGASVDLTGDQRRRMTDRIVELVDLETKVYAASFRQTGSSVFPDDFPYLFHLTGRPPQTRILLHFTTLRDILARDVLSDRQRAELIIVGRERTSSNREAFWELMIQRMDEAVDLSDEQQSQLRLEPRMIDKSLDSPFHSVTQSTSFPSELLLALLTNQSREKLSQLQLRRLGLRVAVSSSPGFNVRPGQALVWRDVLDTASRNLRDLVYQRYLSRIEEVEFERNVGLESGQLLRTAAKGVAVAISDDWRRPVVEQMELLIAQAESSGQPLTDLRYTSSGPSLTVENLESYPLWKYSLHDVLQNSPLKRDSILPAATHLSARAGAVLAMLEQELWLTPQQRQLLLPDVTRLLGTYQTVTPEDENLALLGDMALPLHLLGPDVPRLILFPAQRETFTALAAYFDFRLTANGAQANIAGRDGPIEWRWINSESPWPAIRVSVRRDVPPRPASLPQQLFPALNSGSLPNRINIGKFH